MASNKLPDIKVELPQPWYWCDTDMIRQLLIEINDVHVLANKIVKTVARRQDNDDVLFEIINDQNKYTVVHLTWSQHSEISKEYPKTKLYKNWQDLFDNLIIVDHLDFQK